ncbi:LSU ribosomal protein L23p (L23Ae) [Dissulfuribacter thermophilus]|uniref:Large ribosomal subunit protein uL23 n=1 Tax=Dissulfuribacter thermophilus TaxID=1156395 RepID=A0A1B9F547_9BACT|nr:50S ribosomal protein L23 [Dissulfuribacter thermophilus]OCC15050.1 LSU ribosomal protein L23p (L23Ae) [Dissulfuribacter thermophilus]
MKSVYTILKKPRITEKATFQKELANQVVFEVDPTANKIEIKEAVEKIFKVRVKSVNTVNVKGKPKRVGRHFGRRSSYKKAIVTLYEGETIEFIEGV